MLFHSLSKFQVTFWLARLPQESYHLKAVQEMQPAPNTCSDVDAKTQKTYLAYILTECCGAGPSSHAMHRFLSTTSTGITFLPKNLAQHFVETSSHTNLRRQEFSTFAKSGALKHQSA